MDFENIVCSFELSKKLREFGVKQESLFYWYPQLNGTYIIRSLARSWDSTYSAFTAEELGQILPKSIRKDDSEPFDNYRMYITRFYTVSVSMTMTDNYIVNYECDTTEVSGPDSWLRRKLVQGIYDPSLANAMARMLIHLIENKLYEPK